MSAKLVVAQRVQLDGHGRLQRAGIGPCSMNPQRGTLTYSRFADVTYAVTKLLSGDDKKMALNNIYLSPYSTSKRGSLFAREKWVIIEHAYKTVPCTMIPWPYVLLRIPQFLRRWLKVL